MLHHGQQVGESQANLGGITATLSLRGQTYVAENLLDSHLIALTAPVKHELSRYVESNPTELAAAMMVPDVKMRLAEAIKSIFPMIPDHLVKFRIISLPEGDWKDYALNLTVHELGQVVSAIGIAIVEQGGLKGTTIAAPTKGFGQKDVGSAVVSARPKKRKRGKRGGDRSKATH